MTHPRETLLLMPFEGTSWVTQTFAQHPSSCAGTDWGLAVGTPLRASQGGKIVDVVTKYETSTGYGGNPAGYGNRVKLDLGNQIVIIYGHLKSDIPVVYGQLVQCGEYIGHSNHTGNSTGPHLHYETRYGNVPYDHTPYLRSNIEQVLTGGEIEIPPEIEYGEIIYARTLPTTTPFLNIRYSPNSAAKRVGQIPPNTTFPVFDISQNASNTWMHIGYNQYAAMEYHGNRYAEWVTK